MKPWIRKETNIEITYSKDKPIHQTDRISEKYMFYGKPLRCGLHVLCSITQPYPVR
jgi:hypothetical protein